MPISIDQKTGAEGRTEATRVKEARAARREVIKNDSNLRIHYYNLEEHYGDNRLRPQADLTKQVRRILTIHDISGFAASC